MHVDEPAETLLWLHGLDDQDSRALAELVVYYQPRLLRMVQCRMDVRVRARLDAADVVQETFLDAARQLDGYLNTSPRTLFYVWLRGLAYERLLNCQRQHLSAQCRDVRRELHLSPESSDDLAERFLAAGSTPSRAAMREERRQLVQTALAQLEPPDREILLLLYLEGLTNNEAAQALSLTPSGATMRHGRALKRLEAILADKLKT